MARIGVISDTHGLLRQQARDALVGCDLILHAGDIGSPEVLAALEGIAPVLAVRGNNDTGAWARGIPERARHVVEGVRILVLHDGKELDARVPPDADVVVTGHSHKPLVETRDGVLYVNPGSAGPRRFRLPIAVAHLEIDAHAHLHAEVLELPAD